MPGGRLEGHARQGLQEERLNPNHARQPANAIWCGVRALWEERTERQAEWKSLRAAQAAQAAQKLQSLAKTRRTRSARARREHKGGAAQQARQAAQ